MHGGCTRGQAGVALVFHQHQRPRFSDEHVAARDAHARLQEFFTQQPPRLGRQLGDVVGGQFTADLCAE